MMKNEGFEMRQIFVFFEDSSIVRLVEGSHSVEAICKVVEALWYPTNGDALLQDTKIFSMMPRSGRGG